MTTEEKGYLESGYLEDPYGSGQITETLGFSVLQVVKTQANVGIQASQQVLNHPSPLHMQANQVIANNIVSVGLQALMIVNSDSPVGIQAEQFIHDMEKSLGMQADGVVGASPNVGVQAEQIIRAGASVNLQTEMIRSQYAAIGLQAEQFVTGYPKRLGVSAKADTLRHALLGQYLVEGYLSEGYLTDLMGAFLQMQVNMVNKVDHHVGFQAEQFINHETPVGHQAEMIVRKQKALGFQVAQLVQSILHIQATMVLYNITQLRIMMRFPSRGTEDLLGENWTASTQYSGDFSPNNLNTDVVEQVYRSQAGSASLVTLVCDTGLTQGVPLDTIAILNHNLTKSAIVTVQGSNDPGFGTVNVSYAMSTELINMYFIAPTFPNQAGQNRYWRFQIQDPTNPATYIEIGAIVFGVSDIFSVSESFVNPIRRGYKHFKDSLNTEGFTNVMNDRALKRYLKLSFENLRYFYGNFTILEDMMTFARTSLKVLVIPTPEYPSRFAIFAKLVELPEIVHQSIGQEEEYIDIEFEWDESL